MTHEVKQFRFIFCTDTLCTDTLMNRSHDTPKSYTSACVPVSTHKTRSQGFSVQPIEITGVPDTIAAWGSAMNGLPTESLQSNIIYVRALILGDVFSGVGADIL